MKFLILVCFLGYAAASFLQEAEPAVDQAVLAFFEGAFESKSLGEALGSDDPVFARIEDDLTTEVGKKLKETFQKFLEDIKERIDSGKHIGQEMIDKVKELHQKIKDLKLDITGKGKELLDHIKETIKQLLRKLLQKINEGKPNLDQTMDSVARSKFSDFIHEFLENILSDESIQKLRDYIKKLESEHPFVQKLKEIVQKIKDADLKDILRRLLEGGHGQSSNVQRGETWDKIKDYFKDLKIAVDEHTQKLREFIGDKWDKLKEKVKDKHALIKAIAQEFIGHAKDVSGEVAREALEFLRPYKDDLGALWGKIVDAAKEAIGKF